MPSILKLRPLFALLFALTLTACVSMPKQQAYNRASNAHIKTIEVLPMRHSEIDLFILNNPGYSFGLIGTAIAEANRIPKRNALREQARAHALDHVAALREQLDRAFATHGYELRWPDPIMEPEKGARARRAGNGFRKSYPPASSGVDALLDLNFGFIGYAAAGSGDAAPYRPTAVVMARLVAPDGKQVLFSDFVIYNNVFGQAQAITIDPSDAHRYPDYDDLEAAWPQAIAGLRQAVESAGDELARQFQ
jgi:hypothetical protein